MDDPQVVAQLEKLAAEIEDLKAAAELKLAQKAKTLTEADQLHEETLHQIVLPSVTGASDGTGQQMNGQKPPEGFEGGALAA
jgi:hypothetical protein